MPHMANLSWMFYYLVTFLTFAGFIYKENFVWLQPMNKTFKKITQQKNMYMPW